MHGQGVMASHDGDGNLRMYVINEISGKLPLWCFIPLHIYTYESPLETMQSGLTAYRTIVNTLINSSTFLLLLIVTSHSKAVVNK
jgi:hypothetical protein